MTKKNLPANKPKSMIAPEHADDVKSVKVPTNFIPELKVTYKTSKHFPDKANLGDFYLEEQSLGTSIVVTPIAYNYQSIARKASEPGKGDFIDKLVLPQGDVKFRESSAYAKFKEKHPNAMFEEGLLILVFLPEKGMWGALFAKRFLADGGYQMLKMGADYRILKVTTERQESKKSDRVWFTLKVEDTGKHMEKINDLEGKKDIFLKSIETVATEEESKATSRDR